jgi:hypothetical protein
MRGRFDEEECEEILIGVLLMLITPDCGLKEDLIVELVELRHTEKEFIEDGDIS